MRQTPVRARIAHACDDIALRIFCRETHLESIEPLFEGHILEGVMLGQQRHVGINHRCPTNLRLVA
jgi:hypothetical protein